MSEAAVKANLGSLLAGLVRWRSCTAEPATLMPASVKRPSPLARSGTWMLGLVVPSARVRMESLPAST